MKVECWMEQWCIRMVSETDLPGGHSGDETERDLRRGETICRLVKEAISEKVRSERKWGRGCGRKEQILELPRGCSSWPALWLSQRKKLLLSLLGTRPCLSVPLFFLLGKLLYLSLSSFASITCFLSPRLLPLTSSISVTFKTTFGFFFLSKRFAVVQNFWRAVCNMCPNIRCESHSNQQTHLGNLTSKDGYTMWAIQEVSVQYSLLSFLFF